MIMSIIVQRTKVTHSIKATQSTIESRTKLCLPVAVEARSSATYPLLPIMDERRWGAGGGGKEKAERGGEERAEGGRKAELEAPGLPSSSSPRGCIGGSWESRSPIATVLSRVPWFDFGGRRGEGRLSQLRILSDGAGRAP